MVRGAQGCLYISRGSSQPPGSAAPRNEGIQVKVPTILGQDRCEESLTL